MESPATMNSMEAPIEAHTTSGQTLDIEELCKAIAEAAQETQATDIVLINLEGLVAYTDAFVLCTARNRRQVNAIAEAVRMKVKQTYGKYPLGIEGKERGQWVLVDFGDVVVHIFDQAMRGFYDLDGLWADAPRFDGPDAEVTGEPNFF